MKRRAWLVTCLSGVLAIAAFVSAAKAQVLRITDVRLGAQNDLRLGYPSDTNSYYVLQQGASVTDINNPIQLALGTNGDAQFVVAGGASASSFYRLRKVPIAQPLDTDGDGLDDVFELRNPLFLNPLNPSDALTTIASSSPQNGEGGVAVTRETVFRLSNPLSTNSSVTTSNLYAEFGGRRILSRAELSTDRRTVTLFYLENLPGSARVRVHFDGDALTDFRGKLVDLDGDRAPGGTALLDFDTLNVTPLAGTAVIGSVYASDPVPGTNATNFINRPLRNVTITVDGMEETLRTTTDSNGFFRLQPVPARRFFVLVDGRTATNGLPSGAYYPFVGKAWEAVPGKTNNLAGGTGIIYLPLIAAGTLQPVSASADTTITFPQSVLATNPALAGVAIMVPSNGLFSANGTRGGSVGIAPVSPDRLPEPLPPGLDFPLVITVQTDGPGNFDRPVPVRFPNLPDRITGIRLPPGAKSALWSFNHDTGHWEIQGPMTVTADGNYVESDPGVGIKQPGWHGTRPGVGAGSGPPPGAPPPPDCPDPKPKPDWNPNEHFNGCGPEGADFLVPDLNFFEACKAHDIGYSTCNKPKKDSDDKFLRDMMDACGRLQDPLDRAACTAIANLYHKAVSDGGGGAYESAQADACDCGAPPGGGGPEGKRAVAKAGETAAPTRVSTGLNYFAIIDEQTHQVIVRGKFVGNPASFGTIFMAANTTYRYAVVEAATLLEGSTVFTTPGNGSNIQLPQVLLYNPRSWDMDGDGLHDLSELIVGTHAVNRDTDNDGISDAEEVRSGGDALSGLPAATGVIASVAVAGNAVDVCAVNDLAVLAESTAGIVVFNVASGFNPTRIVTLDTPGSARAVACAGNLIAVADDTAGLAIVDISDPPAARIVHQVALGASAQAVAVAGGIAFVGLSNGKIMGVDLTSGTVIDEVSVSSASVQDVALSGDALYALTVGTLHTISLANGLMQLIGSTSSPGSVGAGVQRLRLFAGGGLAYAMHTSGYNIFSLTNPLAPALLRLNNTTQFGWKQIVPNGSGLGVATVSPNSTPDGPHDVSLYNLNPIGTNSQFITTFVTPGLATAVSIYNGLAYVADGTSGLQVINYLAADTAGNPPTITLTSGFAMLSPTNGLAEEGKFFRLTAQVSDDVQVRNVEFYVDGVKVLVDGNSPFEHRFITPAISTESNFTVRARAFDTGGNFTWTPEILFTLVPDATPPIVRKTLPAPDTISTSAPTVFAYFSEPIDLSTLTATSFRLTYAGADNKLDTGDDVSAGGTISWRETLNAAALSFSTPLSLGLYRATVTIGIKDVAGHPLQNNFTWTFWLLTSGLDGDDDDDGLLNTNEIARGLNPLIADSDGDGWTDGVEIADGTDPLHPNSMPRTYFVASPPVDVLFPAFDEAGTNALGLTMGRPPVEVLFPDVDEASLASGVTIGRPPVELIFPDADEAGSNSGVTVGRPPVEIVFPDVDEAGSNPGVTIGRPPVEVIYPASDEAESNVAGITLGRPPIVIRFVP